MATEEKWVYTRWGYGKLAPQNSPNATVSLTYGGILYTSSSSISSSIHLSVKLFSSSRKLYEYDWNIAQDFTELFSLLHKQLSLPPNIQLTLYYTKGRLIKLQPTDTPLDLKLKSETKFIGITKQNFTWDALKKAANIEILEDLLSVKKKDDSEVTFDSVLGTIEMNSGVHHWEIKMDFFMEYEEEEEVYIGVAAKGIGLERIPFECEYWGFMCITGKKFALGNSESYGESITTGDTVGVRLEFKENKGELSFSKNGNDFGPAFCDVPAGVFPVVTLNYPKFQVSLGKSGS